MDLNGNIMWGCDSVVFFMESEQHKHGDPACIRAGVFPSPI